MEMKSASVALLVFAVAAALGDLVQAQEEGHLYQHRKRVGHFNEEPFLDVYPSYVKDKMDGLGRSDDHYERYTPTAPDCGAFLDDYVLQKNYQEKEIQDFIMVDACMGYIYTSKYQDIDIGDNEPLRQKLLGYAQDERLGQLYNNTKIEQFGLESKICVANLLLNAVYLRAQQTSEVSSSDWIEIYLRFAECQAKNINPTLRVQDTYLEHIYQLVKEGATRCYENEFQIVNDQVRKEYNKNYVGRAANYFRSMFSQKGYAKQIRERKYPEKFADLLKIVQGTDRQINLRLVHKLLRGFYTNDEGLTRIFMQNIANFADKHSKPIKGDADGSQRYKIAINEICFEFRSSDGQKFNFPKSFIRLIEMLSYYDVFGVDSDQFIADAFNHAYETSIMYLGISLCNVLTHTKGELVQPRGSRKKHYEVTVVDYPKGMVRWLDGGHY